jgi:hypothetical protein
MTPDILILAAASLTLLGAAWWAYSDALAREAMDAQLAADAAALDAQIAEQTARFEALTRKAVTLDAA